MTDLTEQFDNDEITKGSYYCKSKLDGHICIAGFISNKGLFDCDYNGTLNKGYWEVLAPVPSYDEWKEYQELDEDNKRNAQLAILFSLRADIFKELLKECKEVMNMAGYVFSNVDDVKKAKELLQKIDEVLNA